MPSRPFPQRYLQEFRHYFHPEDKDLRNPRVKCFYCGNWLTIDARDGTRQVVIQCPYNTFDRRHLAPGIGTLKKPQLLCKACCDDHCQPRAIDGATHAAEPWRSANARPQRKTRQPPADWDSGSRARKKFVNSQKAQDTLNRCGIALDTPFEMLTDVQVARLLSCTTAWRFYRSEGDERAQFFLARLNRLANAKI